MGDVFIAVCLSGIGDDHGFIDAPVDRSKPSIQYGPLGSAVPCLVLFNRSSLAAGVGSGKDDLRLDGGCHSGCNSTRTPKTTNCKTLGYRW